MEKYKNEVSMRWGDTAAYREHTEKTKGYSKEKWQQVNEGLTAIFADFAACNKRGDGAESKTSQVLVQRLKDYITENYYTCTNDILAGLGQMYLCDERFKNNINKCGEGTAEFVSAAIKLYVAVNGERE